MSCSLSFAAKQQVVIKPRQFVHDCAEVSTTVIEIENISHFVNDTIVVFTLYFLNKLFDVITKATKKGKRAIGAKRAEIRVRGKKFNKSQKRQNTVL